MASKVVGGDLIRRPWFFNIVFHTTDCVLHMISDPVTANVFLKPIFQS